MGVDSVQRERLIGVIKRILYITLMLPEGQVGGRRAVQLSEALDRAIPRHRASM